MTGSLQAWLVLTRGLIVTYGKAGSGLTLASDLIILLVLSLGGNHPIVGCEAENQFGLKRFSCS